MTLLELILVLAVISVFAAISWPMLQRPLLKSRVQNGALELSKALAEVRVRAVESGAVYAFRYDIGGTFYEMSPAELMAVQRPGRRQDSLMIAESTLGQDSRERLGTSNSREGRFGEPGGSLDEQSEDDSSLEEAVREELSAGVSFLDPNQLPLSVEPGSRPRELESTAGDSAAIELEVEPLAAELVDLDQSRSPNWSPPIFFYPDGRATNAELQLVGDAYQVGVTVRGLTGAVSMGGVQRREAEVVE